MSISMHAQAEPPHIVGYAPLSKYGSHWWFSPGCWSTELTHRPILALLGLLVITPSKASLVFFYSCTSNTRERAQVHGCGAIAVLIIFIGLNLLRLSVQVGNHVWRRFQLLRQSRRGLSLHFALTIAFLVFITFVMIYLVIRYRRGRQKPRTFTATCCLS